MPTYIEIQRPVTVMVVHMDEKQAREVIDAIEARRRYHARSTTTTARIKLALLDSVLAEFGAEPESLNEAEEISMRLEGDDG